LIDRISGVAMIHGVPLVDDFVCVTVQANQGETEADFSARLSRFWTHMLRQFPDDFEKVYAESAEFDDFGDRIARKYLAVPSVTPFLASEMQKHGIDCLPVDPEDTYSKYEAVAPDWWQIEH